MRKIIVITILSALIGAVLPFHATVVQSQTKDELRQELVDIEKQIAAYEQELNGARAEKQTLTNKIKRLKSEQSKIQLEIHAGNLRMDELGQELNNTQEAITIATTKIADYKIETADLLRGLHQQDGISLLEVVVGADSLTEIMNQMENLQVLSEEVTEKSKDMRSAKEELAEKEQALEAQQEEISQMIAMQVLRASEYQARVSEQNDLLAATKGVEAEYQAVLNESRQKAAQIRARLYDLAGGATTKVTFGEAVELSKQASQMTGVRAALLLAVLTQESSLGKNVGTCNRPGDPESKSWRNVMHPTRDLPKFEAIVKELGLDPAATPVSCPMMQNGKRVGWGGAMGPAQFIPSTWVGYKDKVTALTGRPANPWDIRDAFVAAGVLLKANGATKDGKQGEWNAAMRYFSGSTNPKYRFYGDSVMKQTEKYQAEIDALSGG